MDVCSSAVEGNSGHGGLAMLGLLPLSHENGCQDDGSVVAKERRPSVDMETFLCMSSSVGRLDRYSGIWGGCCAAEDDDKQPNTQAGWRGKIHRALEVGSLA